MGAEVLDGETVRRWCRLSADALAQTRAAIDALNVFPVPDADTGTNLYITLMSAAEAAEALPPGAGPAEIWQAATQGALLGACGNSGIIISQLLRGLAEVCAAESRCDGPVVARALAHAAASARAAVSLAEGTVLTVADAAARAGTGVVAGIGVSGTGAAGTGVAGTGAVGTGVAGRGSSAAGAQGRSAGLAAVVTAAATAAREALARTTGQLDVLAASGVVDAGAAGLCVLLDALVAAITGVRPEVFEVPPAASRPARGLATASRSAPEPAHASRPAPGPATGSRPAPGPAPAPAAAPAAFGYEVTYLLEAPAEPVRQLRGRLDLLGDSLVIVGGEELWNVHVHVADAGAAIEEGLRAGRPRRITVTWLGPPADGGGGQAPAGGHAVVAVAESDGLASLLHGAGARVLRQVDHAGPAMPALVEVIRQAGTRVAVIPNSGRVAGLAQAAAARLAGEGIDVSVVPARSALQGLAALAVHDPRRAFGEDVAAMGRAAAGMRYGSVIGADSGGFTGLDGDEVRVIAEAQCEVAGTLAAVLLSQGGELMTLMEGAGAQPGLARLVADEIGRLRPEVEVVCYEGGPVPLLIGVE